MHVYTHSNSSFILFLLLKSLFRILIHKDDVGPTIDLIYGLKIIHDIIMIAEIIYLMYVL